MCGSQGEVLDSRSVNQSPSRRQRRNWASPSLSDTKNPSTVLWRSSSDADKEFHSLQRSGCFSFQHLGNSSSHSQDKFHNPSLHTSTLTVRWTSHITSLRPVLPLAALALPSGFCPWHVSTINHENLGENLGLLRQPGSSPALPPFTFSTAQL